MLNKARRFRNHFFDFSLKERPTFVQIFQCFSRLCRNLFIIKPVDGRIRCSGHVGALGGMSAGLAYTFVRFLAEKAKTALIIFFFFSVFVPYCVHTVYGYELEPFTFKALSF